MRIAHAQNQGAVNSVVESGYVLAKATPPDTL